MVQVHFNGDIVRGPNIAEIQRRSWERKEKQGVCRYNKVEITCKNWIEYAVETGCVGKCPLAGSERCPGHKTRKKTGQKKKTYKIDTKTYRKLSSAAHYMIKEAPNKTLFITLTLPKFKKEPNEIDINKSFSKFMENLHNNYGVRYYVAVKERGTRGGRTHFHVLLNIRYTAFTILNNAWLAAISDYCHASKNALTTDRKNVILRNPARAMRYVCKYFSKSRGQQSDTRLVFMSVPLIMQPIS